MQITVNGESREIDPGTTVEALIAQLGLDKAITAAEVNKQLVRKPDRDTHTLAEGDTVEIVTLVGGG